MAITLGNVTASGRKTGASYTWSHIVENGADLIIVTSAIHSGGSGRTVSSITCGSLSLSVAKTNGDSTVEIWYGINPPAGTQTITVTYGSSTNEGACSSLTFFGVDKSNPIYATVTGSSSGTPIATLNALLGGVIIDCLYQQSASTAPGTGQTTAHNTILTNESSTSGSSYKLATFTSSTNMIWTANAVHSMCALSIRPKANNRSFLI